LAVISGVATSSSLCVVVISVPDSESWIQQIARSVVIFGTLPV